MKNNLIIAAAAVAGALVVIYLMRKKEMVKQVADPVTVKKSHHLTDVFAHAKAHID